MKAILCVVSVEGMLKAFEHIFKCQDGLVCPLNRHDITLESFVDFTDTRFLKRVGKYLIKFEKFGEVVI